MAETTKKKKIPTVEIISKEMIKPSLPTPSHLRSHSISSLDQFSNLSYIRVVFFYNRPSAGEDAVSGDTNDIIQILRTSLSETLTHYYPLAGKFVEKDALIDCDDSGAEFSTAVIANGDDGDFLGAIENPNMGFLEKLVSKENDDIMKSDDAIVSIQITRFPAGEFAVGVCISHKISDAATLCSFMKLWSSAARIIISGESSFKELTVLRPVFNAPKLWPSVPGFLTPPMSNYKGEKIMKKLVFNPSSLTRLKAALSGIGKEVPTRVTSLMTLIWHAIMDSSSSGPHWLIFPTNIRKKMSPPISDNTLGNITKIAAVEVEVAVDGVAPPLAVVLGMIKETLGKVDEEYAKKHGPPIHEPFSRVFSSMSLLNRTIITSWCWFPFYEVELGMGRPIWMTCLRRTNLDDTLLIDRSDGGIDALISLDVEKMEKFEKNTTLLSFCDNYVTYG